MQELQDLIKFLKDKGLEHQKINVDVLCGIIEHFANKQETKQCNIADVSNSTDYQEPIDIYSEEGTKVKYTGKGGYNHHKDHANKHLKVGEIYTIDYTDVGGWHTDVYLKEVPNQAFNSVHFVNVE